MSSTCRHRHPAAARQGVTCRHAPGGPHRRDTPAAAVLASDLVLAQADRTDRFQHSAVPGNDRSDTQHREQLPCTPGLLAPAPAGLRLRPP